ncbi:MAG: hypothetical protein Satyrvirus6_34 [Satyrvirus sp.]|uniref:Uncharacterized protein n=1 Tax=Satyrvirus sp. TaxID=2487771 RepID=A0A3G5ADE2_9VIRU|nr:MAG: hypothetical protein Satyrvirus6_34 [Satyrvirus sp.]
MYKVFYEDFDPYAIDIVDEFYIRNKNTHGPILLQIDDVIPLFNDAKPRITNEFINVPRFIYTMINNEPESEKEAALKKYLDMIDSFLCSDEIRKKIFGDDWNKYEYVPLIEEHNKYYDLCKFYLKMDVDQYDNTSIYSKRHENYNLYNNFSGNFTTDTKFYVYGDDNKMSEIVVPSIFDIPPVLDKYDICKNKCIVHLDKILVDGNLVKKGEWDIINGKYYARLTAIKYAFGVGKKNSQIKQSTGIHSTDIHSTDIHSTDIHFSDIEFIS